MFKLVKIEGSGSNQAEPVRIKTAPSTLYRANCAYAILDGYLVEPGSDFAPTHIALESLDRDEKETLLCYCIYENMIFEAPLYGNSNNLTVGTKYALHTDDNDAGIGMSTSTANGKLTLHDINGARKTGDTVYVRVTK